MAHASCTSSGMSVRLTHAAIFSGTGRQRRQARVQAFKVVLSTSIENETEKVREEAVSTSQEEIPAGEQKIYVGNGRFVVDDPRKYPDRNALTGGFAGGEVGLKNFVSQMPGGITEEAVKRDNASNVKSKARSDLKKGLYVGSGRYLPDDPSSMELLAVKKTGRDSSLTGGFAGGEVGLRQFVETGEVPFAPVGSGRKQQSPLIVAGIVSAAAVIGGIILSDASDFSEVFFSKIVSSDAANGLDDNTKNFLKLALLLAGTGGVYLGGRAVIGKVTRNMAEGAQKLLTLTAFWLCVLFAVKIILDSP